MTDEDGGTIVVEALDHRREFTGREELATFVGDVIRDRGGIFDPFELKAIQTLAALNGGAVDSDVRRIAQATAIIEPRRERIKTPFDGRIEATEADVRAAELTWHDAVGRRARVETELEAMRRRLRIQHRDDAVARADAVAEAEKEATPRWREALMDQEEADRHLLRLRARRSALREARRRWLVEHTGQFYDRDNPDVPLSLAEMRARRDAESEGG